MHKDIKKVIKSFENFDDVFKYAYVGFPKGFNGLKKPFYGRFNELKIKETKKFPVVLYMHGSSGLYRGGFYRKIITNEGFIFFAPDSFKLKNRPTYKTPTKEENYIKVHKIRLAEIDYVFKKLKKLPFVDEKNIFLMGNSEGGLAVAVSRLRGCKGRIVTAFSCESTYFYSNFKPGFSKNTPFLNIIGTHDEFFSKDSEYNKNFKVNGHGIELLKDYKYAKIVVLGKAKHDLTRNVYIKDDIISFLRIWRER